MAFTNFQDVIRLIAVSLILLSQLAVSQVTPSIRPFPLNRVRLTNSRWTDNQARTVTYLKFIDVERLLYNFRANHGVSTKGAAALGGWDAPNFPFRTHMQGHFLTAWAYCYASLGDTTCRDRALYFVAELAKCQASNGYLSGFPESDFDLVEARKLTNGNVPYYAVHKTMAGLLDVWQLFDDNTARDVLLKLAGWVDNRTSKLSSAQMQAMLGTEFGGMNDVLADIYHQTGDKRWLTVAQRFDHASVFDPLASNQDRLDGLHANTQVPKWIGAVKEYTSTGASKYLAIARNAWNFTVNAHTYAIGGNSQAEHFRAPNKISGYLSKDTAEGCNTYNMLKLTRELWMTDSSVGDKTHHFDFYERALINHMLGQQNPQDKHGHITYFTSLNPGGRRGVGPAWGGGTWSTDHNSFWCCQGTGIETNTKLMDSVYFTKDEPSSKVLYVNLFTPSVLNWAEQSVTITQTTGFPVEDTTTLLINSTRGDSAGNWALRIRIPSWTSPEAEVRVNGEKVAGLAAVPGTYFPLQRDWKNGDRVTVRLPMFLRAVPANDNPSIAAFAYGPAVLAGNYGDTVLSAVPKLALDTVRRASGDKIEFEVTADSKSVRLQPFYDAHGHNYNVYWATSGRLPA
ncbi:hypothetical protein B0T16DRAFT_196255 [Cercophora newfieldiana]|uniref:DUF1680-domain-containing protein n=1 Tax=Cercophora newfieldiana TaxID=92897 RepID=A0AA39Y264_9PEZI|nr:hypothetical protein B0T16DRAFT_196255 [Cercophora newfieldiana]